MADLLLCVRRILEYDRSGAVRVHDQSAHCTLLHAGAEHDTCTWTCGIVWRLWDAWNWLDAGLPAGLDSRSRMERWLIEVFLLGHEWRADGDVRAELVTRGTDANVGFRGSWLLVRPQPRIHADADLTDLTLDAGAGRHGILSGSRGPSLVCGRIKNRSLLPKDGCLMTWCDLDTSVPEWIIEHPETLSVFQELGIDYCCGGKSLAYACQEQGLEVEIVLSMLQQRLNGVSKTASARETKGGN